MSEGTTSRETEDVMEWTVTTDRNGRRAYVLPTGQIVSKDGCGGLPVTVLYASETGDYGMTDTVREAKAWGEMDAADNAARVSA